MSSQAARTAFRADLAATYPAVPIFATLGVRVDNNTLPDLWLTDDFISLSDNAISIGSPACYRELGTYRVFVVSRAGAGEAAGLAQADAVAAHYRRWSDASGNIRTVGVVPPMPSDASDGRWLVTVVDVSFTNTYVS